MDYSATVEYLFSRLPMYQRVGAAAYKVDLSNTIALCDLLGNPQRSFKSIHVAGTNGKGSVSSTLASIFSTCGYKVGLFTSPHLKDFRERIRINGKMITEQAVIDFVAKTSDLSEHLKPSFFEISCAMAFDYFAHEKVDIAILEVGMGGRLDSTNVVLPNISVITSIGLDHQQFLGDTLEEIAAEKGGIIKDRVPVVIGENSEAIYDVLSTMAKKKNAPFYLSVLSDERLETDLAGSYQRQNMRTVWKTVEVARSLGWSLNPGCVKEGALNVVKNTGLRGRWELIGSMPRVIADVGHNEDGVRMVMDMVRRESFVRLHIVWGMVSDKDAKKILALLPTSATYYWCRPDIPRGKNERQLADEALKFSLEGKAYSSVSEALRCAKEDATPNDLILVGGSVFVVAEVV